MAGRALHTTILTTLLALVVAGVVSARPTIDGGFGVEFDGYDFTRTVRSTGEKEDDVSRSLSTPYVDVWLKSALWDERIAHLSLGGRFSGSWYRSMNQGEGTTGSRSPALTRYDARLSLFGARPFPLGLWMNKSEIPSLRYEVNNRAASDLQSPTLAVIRRYDTVAEQRGAIWKFSLPRRTTLSFTAQQNKDTVNRQYDFGEDRDIFVDFALIRPDDTVSSHLVAVRNEIPDDTVLMFLDQVLVDTLTAGESVLLTVEAGVHDTEFVPLKLNPFRGSVNVRGPMQWRIIHNQPPGSKDVSRTSDIVRTTFSTGGEGPFRDEAFFVFDKSQEDVQRLDSSLTTFNNLATYTRSRSTQFDFLTTVTSTSTDVRDVSSQSGDSFVHQTTARHRRRRGLNAQASHSFGKASTKTDVSDIATTSNTFLGSATMPTGYRTHVAAARVSASFLSDNVGYESRQYSGEIENHIELRTRRVLWRPRHALKYTTGKRKNPDGSTNEVESRLMLTGDIVDLGMVGLASVKGEHTWRRRETNAETGTKNTYLGEIRLSSRTMKGAKIGFSTGHELQTFGRAAVVEPDGGITPRGLENQVRHTYRIDLESAVRSSFTAGLNAMLLTTNDTRVRRLMASATIRVPRINLPIRSSLIDESRDLVGQPTQRVFEVQTRVSFGIRRIRLVMSHTFSKDRQLTEEYGYQEFLVRLARNFEVW